ncbi:Uncharacterised protein [uncultured archaeon]|nr:Uncharacterised protein [uncultured archaeon]
MVPEPTVQSAKEGGMDGSLANLYNKKVGFEYYAQGNMPNRILQGFVDDAAKHKHETSALVIANALDGDGIYRIAAILRNNGCVSMGVVFHERPDDRARSVLGKMLAQHVDKHRRPILELYRAPGRITHNGIMIDGMILIECLRPDKSDLAVFKIMPCASAEAKAQFTSAFRSLATERAADIIPADCAKSAPTCMTEEKAVGRCRS